MCAIVWMIFFIFDLLVLTSHFRYFLCCLFVRLCVIVCLFASSCCVDKQLIVSGIWKRWSKKVSCKNGRNRYGLCVCACVCVCVCFTVILAMKGTRHSEVVC